MMYYIPDDIKLDLICTPANETSAIHDSY